MIRLFVAIRPPPPIRDILLDLTEQEADLRWQSDHQIHLTLRFIGEVDRHQADDIGFALSTIRFPAFDLRLCGLGSFDHPRGGAIWSGITPKTQVMQLAAKVERACQSAGLAPERRAFLPHITIARWSGRRSSVARDFLTGRDMPSIPFTVSEFALYRSYLSRHGAQYEPMARYLLA